MRKITLDSASLTKLAHFTESLEVCDDAGHTLGYVLSPEEYRRLAEYKRQLYALVAASCPYTEEELRRFEQEPGGRPLAEIWKSLGQT